MSNRRVHSMIPLLLLIFIVGIVLIIKGSVKTSGEEYIQAYAAGTEYFHSAELNISERTILAMLLRGMELAELKNEGTVEDEYYVYLKEYFSSPGIYLGPEVVREVEESIKGINAIINLERVNDLKQMSLDGRSVAIGILRTIYESCGLKVVYTSEGVISQISDQSGNMIYTNSNTIKQSDFQLNTLIIAVFILLSLLVICFVIAKKNQLFIRDGIYDGFDEKGFA